MHLKRLEIQGFKSFADKTLLEFKPGITMVVGPNGSGKSNIADAIRWVLGEQSVKTLRGGKMEDIIFAGSEKRRSLGMAEVSLTIDNSQGIFPLEFNEVTVTRRLYRSGESDFLINRVPCRLRDIHELFMDTGVGREGFSIIGQGKIDEILSVKPEERRGLIEEAAGIVKYRHRKREAERKLDDTETSLIRLNDIVAELSTQEEPLAEQARIAAIYQDLKEELDAQEIGLIVEEVETTARRLENTKNSRLTEEQELAELRTKFHLVSAEGEEFKLLLQKKEEKLATCQERVYTENLRLEKNESEKKLIQERTSDLDIQEELLRRDLQQLANEETALEKERQEHVASGENLSGQLTEAQNALALYEKQLEEERRQDQALEEKLEKVKGEHFESLQEETKIHNDKESHTQRLSILERQEEQVQTRRVNTLQSLDEVNRKLAELEKDEAELLITQDDLQASLEEAEKACLEQETKYINIQKENRRLQEEKSNSMARLKVLNEMEKEGQGYSQGVREVLKKKSAGHFSGVIGTVAQAVGVPKEYETAVEVVLGNTLQHLITTDETVAKEAIFWLKENDKGRATFLPLTTIKSGKTPERPPQGAGVIGRLSDLLQYEERFTPIMEFLMGRVYLIQDLSTALKKAKESNFAFRLVTLDGQLVNPGGSLTGGSIRPAGGSILSRKRNISELEQEIQRLENRNLRGENEEKTAQIALQDIKREIEQLKASLQDGQIKKAENNKIQERWRADRERYLAELESTDWQISEIIQEKEDILLHLKTSEQDVENLRQKVQSLALLIQELQEKTRENQAQKQQSNEKLTQLRVEMATIQEKIVSYQKDLQYYSQRLAQLEKQKNEKEQEILETGKKKSSLQETLTAMEKEKEKQVAHLHELEQQLEELKAGRQEIQQSISDKEQESRVLSGNLHIKEEKIHQYELTISKYEAALEASIRRLAEQYELELEQAKNKGSRIDDRRKSQQRITEIKEEIISLGPVNIAAIEEYRKLKERLEFLAVQIQDMTEAKERLLQVIKEMDQIMARKFKETFQLVNEHFQELFIRLFGGGKAQLVLTETEDILEAGIEIIAQPPGKKTQSLSLLSGGERSLTAIALLMAVLEVKPSPFCVLDEIESNLDEANVRRFAQMLEEFSSDTQFIVISHHKGTMEVAHVLYGVTIEENGVSRMISVKLEDVKKEAS